MQLQLASLKRDRPLHDVPIAVWVFLLCAIGLQLLWHSRQPTIVAHASALQKPLPVQAYILSSLDDPLVMSKILNLWLQSYDDQPGISLSFRQLNYHRIAKWLDMSLALDPKGRYPLLVATRVYGGITDPKRKRFMLNYVYKKFKEDPNHRWMWLAYAVVMAKHELKDLPLALKYADALTRLATGKNVPYWARDMKIFILEDMGEDQDAKALIGGLLESGAITDRHELSFLTKSFKRLQKKSSSH